MTTDSADKYQAFGTSISFRAARAELRVIADCAVTKTFQKGTILVSRRPNRLLAVILGGRSRCS
jgi:hypothetical protein